MSLASLVDNGMFEVGGRLSLFLGSPIDAGVLFAATLPWFYCSSYIEFWATGAVRCRYISRFVCGALLLGLALTQSRGPLVAVIGTAAYELITGVARRRGGRAASVVVVAVGVLLVCSWVTGTMSRVSQAVSVGDRSVTNRLTIWESIPAMLYLAPLAGLGRGEAGYFYCQWYEPKELGEQYTTVFNTPAEIGVERGVPVLIIYLIANMTVALYPFFGSKCRRALSRTDLSLLGATMSLFSAFVSGLTSTQLNGQMLFITAINCLVVLYCYGRDLRRAGKALGVASLFCVFLTATSYAYCLQRWRGEFEVEVGKDHTTKISRTISPESEKENTAIVLVDRGLMGNIYGKDLRNWLRVSKFKAFVVLDPRFALPRAQLDKCQTVIMVGHTVSFCGLLESSKVHEVILVHPTCFQAISGKFTAVRIVLPKSDEGGSTVDWESAAHKNSSWTLTTNNSYGSWLGGSDMRL